MAICQLMIQDFMYGWVNNGYSKSDLEIGKQYAEDLIRFEHRKYEPFHVYNLKDFIKWVDAKLNFNQA